VKVLYVGEGNHDIGPAPANPNQPRTAAGPIPTLVRKIQPAISEDSLALAWRELARFNRDAKKRGYEAKVKAALLLAESKFGCAGCILVVDQDRDEDRRTILHQAAQTAPKRASSFPVVVGVAVESVEAWTLGARGAVAAVLGLDLATIERQYPSPHVESLHENSGKEEHRPKRLLQKIADLARRSDGLDLRTQIAEKTEVADLEVACPSGFAPFARAIREQFPT